MVKAFAFALLAFIACAPSQRTVKTPSSIFLGKPPQATGDFHVPVKNPKVLSRFGKRGGRYHTGIDIRGRKGGGDLAYASRPGRVIKVARLGGYGNIVIIKHEDGYTTRYAHLRAFKVRQGQRVQALDPVGVIGRTGRATTEHLHFEIVTPEQKFVNPENFLWGLRR